MYGFSRREKSWWSFPYCSDPTSESKVGSILDLTRISPSILLRRSLVSNPDRTRVRHDNVPWMIHISGSGADEHIKLSMWLRALTAQAQRRNYQRRALPLS
ncbi:hypothetical protein HAX54_044456 [Datura stramonium]|uniref:Uncharacterized protein n=1 Tax=Datura stramonium TaxID=4076 RepID=A0ABS8WGK4_DATST|nr:hypothetical protein [Datura stramonium]